MSELQDPRTRALEWLQEMEVTVQNPIVRGISAHLINVNPEKLVERIEKAFPAKFEQQVYLGIIRVWKRVAFPETIAACFNFFNSGQTLVPADFVGKGKANVVLENTAETLTLMSRGFVSKEVAMRFVQRFGDRAEEVYNLIGENLQYLMRRLGIRTYSREAMLGILHAIAYSDVDHPLEIDLDVATIDDLERLLGCFTDWPSNDE